MAKTCGLCREAKPLEDFHRSARGVLGRQAYCRPCALRYSEQRRRLTGYDRERRYGLTQEAFDRLYESQEGRCAICSGTISGRNCHVDHDHGSGTVRGLLCFNCNSALGKLGDSPRLLRRAAHYLEIAQGKEILKAAM